MSWLIGIFGKITKETEKKLKKILPSDLLHFASNESWILSSGGCTSTTFWKINESDPKWIAVGQGINKTNQSIRFNDFTDWDNYFLQTEITEDKDFNKPDGHFVCSLISKNRVIFFNDKVGIRELYYCEFNGLKLVSTRADLITRFTNYVEIDFEAFSSGWYLENKMSARSDIKNIQRITANGFISINLSDSTKTLIRQYPWQFEKLNKIDSDSILTELNSLIDLGFNELNKDFSLALSGGMDSRVLFSLLYQKSNQINKPFSTFTFGNPLHPDNKIAEKIARSYKIQHIGYYDNLLANPIDYNELIDYSAMNFATSPLSEYYHKKYYKTEFNSKVIIDGGFGEILRRGLFNKLQYFCKKEIFEFYQTQNDKAIDKFIKYTWLPKADIFNYDTHKLMIAALKPQIIELFNLLPDPNEVGFENWLDILAIRTKLINYCSLEQARIDQYCLSYNPFSQDSILQKSIALPTKFKKDAYLFRQIISNQTSIINNLPLVKGSVIVPQMSSTILQKIAVKVKHKTGLYYKDDTSIQFLKAHKVLITDIINSDSFKSDSHYNQVGITQLIDDFYNGNSSLSGSIDWFLSFHLFQQSLKK